MLPCDLSWSWAMVARTKYEDSSFAGIVKNNELHGPYMVPDL